MKFRILLSIFLLNTLLNANDFREGMIAYKEGNYSKASSLFSSSIEKEKTIHSYYMLGRLYLKGQGVPMNTKIAIGLLSYAYKHGNVPSGCYLREALISNNNKESAQKIKCTPFKRYKKRKPK